MTTRPADNLTSWIVALCAITLTVSVACGVSSDEEPDVNNTMTTTPDMTTTPTDMDTVTPQPDMGTVTPQNDMDPVVTPDADMGTVTPGALWTVSTHPCSGNRTDALFCDDDLTCFTGCGTTAEGRGLYMTRDGGATWGTMQTTPEDIFDQSRVNDIWRSPDDGKLYVSGEHSNGFRVLSVDPEGNLGEVFKAKGVLGFGFTAGSFRRDPNGRAIAESLNGNDIIYRNMDSDDPTESWSDGREFSLDQTDGVQILAMDVNGTDFYGAGSTINQPPMVFLPAWDDEFDFDILQFSEPGTLGSYTGELWDVDVNEEGIVVGGVNQDSDVGMVHVFNFEGGLAPNDLDNWKTYKLSTLFPGKSTWIQGTCRDNGVIYAVGRESREGWGIVIRSKDGGDTWEDISPYDAGSTRSSLKDMYRCHVTSTGGVIVAGEIGSFAVYEE